MNDELMISVTIVGYGIYAWVKRRDAWQSSKAGHLAMMEEGHHGH